MLWLRRGKVEGHGDPRRVVDAYLTYVAGGEDALLARERPAAQAGEGEAPAGIPGQDDGRHGYREGRWGGREVEITAVRLLDQRGRERHVYVPGESLALALTVRAGRPVSDFVFGVGLFTADGVSVFGTNTNIEDFEACELNGEAEVRFEIQDLRLVEGTYLVDVAAHRRDGTPYDYHRGQHSFRVKSRIKDVGVYRPQHRWSFAGAISVKPPEPRPELDLQDE